MSHLTGGRDPSFERAFLAQAERLAGMAGSGYTEEVLERLHHMEREKGADSYLDLGLLRIVREIGAEGLDVGGWPLTGSLAAYVQIEDLDKRHQFHLLMQQIAAYGPLIRELCRQAHDLLTE